MKKLKKLSVFLAMLLVVACASNNQGTDAENAAVGAEGNKAVDFKSVSTVYFDFDRSDVKTNEAKKLDSQAQWLKANKNANVTVEGHTDYVGTSEYNLALGERRASASKGYLVRKGVEGKRISTVSYGKDKPVNPAETDEARAENRRTVSVTK